MIRVLAGVPLPQQFRVAGVDVVGLPKPSLEEQGAASWLTEQSPGKQHHSAYDANQRSE
jgi:hypothetical protein